MTAEEKAAIDARVENEIREDVAVAEASPFPSPDDAAQPVWA
jgi:TPP-dependent pyruvate/acetoin dehydrogenase alpha subunit